MILLKHIFEICTSPASILTFLTLVTVWLSFRSQCHRSLRACLILLATTQLVFLSAPLGEIMIGCLEKPYQPLLAPETRGPIRWIVVLSAYGIDHPGTPISSNLSEETLYRL